MSTITCLVLGEEEQKKWRMKEITEKQTEEEARGGAHTTKLPSYVGAYHRQQALAKPNNVQTDWQLLLYCCVSTHYILDDLLMRHPTDAYYLVAI